MNKYFYEVITHKALGFKLSSSTNQLLNVVVEKSPDFKNVCAPLHKEMIEELESTISLLKLSKREFITMAIQNALDEAHEIISDIDAFEYQVEAMETEK